MTERVFDDPILELNRRNGGDPGDVLDLAGDSTDEEAETVLQVLDEVEAEQHAASLAGRLRQMGHRL